MHIGIAGPADLDLLSDRLVGPKPLGGGIRAPIVSNLARHLLDRGHTLTVFTLSPNCGDQGKFVGPLLNLIVLPYRRRLRWIDAFRSERRLLAAAMTGSDCDIFHAHWTYEYALAALSTKRPTLVTVHDWSPQVLRHHRHIYRLVRLGMQVRTIRKAPELTANSPYIAGKVQQFFHRAVPVVPNGVGIPDRVADRRVNPYFVAGALNNGFSNLKNVEVLLQAFGEMRAHDAHATLRLAGSGYGPGEPAYLWATAQGYLDGVEFLGAIPPSSVPDFMRSLDLFVHPSLEESFGMVLLEALKEGTAVVAGKASGAVPWVLGNGLAGTLVDVESPKSLGRAILELAADPNGRRESAAAGFRYIRSNFSLDYVVDLYEWEYQRIVGR